jgi:serine protease Do
MSYNDEERYNDEVTGETPAEPQSEGSYSQPEQAGYTDQSYVKPQAEQSYTQPQQPAQDAGYQWSGSSYRSSTPQQDTGYSQPAYGGNNGYTGYNANPNPAPNTYSPNGYNGSYYNPYGGYNTPPVPPKKKGHGGVVAAIIAAVLVVCIGIGVGCGVVVHSKVTGNDTTTAESAPAVTEAPEESVSGSDSDNSGSTQVILGGSNNKVDEASANSGAAGTMDAKSIYSMACQQVVGITTEVTSQNIFGQTVTGAVSGSGFIISADGYIATNYHVISTAVSQDLDVTVMMIDGTTYTAQIIGGDEDNDVAVLKIDATGLNAVTLGDSNNMAVGETVYAVGNPLGELTYTMTSGIVSALDREISTDSSTSINMFQLDAAVNSGNSGGPVYNSDGEVIGIVTAKYSETGVEGLNFAIPINDAVAIIKDLLENGYVTGKPYMGITAVTVSSSVAQYYNMVEGAYVYAVDSTACAAKAGLQKGDIVTAMDGNEITSSSDLVSLVKQYKAGDTVTLDVYRDGKTIQLTMTFDEKTQSSGTASPDDQQSQIQKDQDEPQDKESGGYGFYNPFSGNSMN